MNGKMFIFKYIPNGNTRFDKNANIPHGNDVYILVFHIYRRTT